MTTAPTSIELQRRKRPWSFSLRALIIATAVLGAGVGLFGKFAIQQINPPTEAELYEEFIAYNPATLVGWAVVEPDENRPWLSWHRDGLVYFDRNGDGRPDEKFRESPRLSTNDTYWQDADFDGMFDTEVERGCFHRVARLLAKQIAVPAVSATKK
jgi:hypothetical protein